MLKRRDDALNTAVATVILFAIAFLIFASAFAWVSRAAETPERSPRGLILAGESGVRTVPTGEAKTWSIAAVSAGTYYSELSWRLAGHPLPCASAWGTTDAWRVYANGVLVTCDGDAPADLLVQPGDLIEIIDVGAGIGDAPGLRGQDVQVIDVPVRTVMFTIPVA